MYEKLQGIVLNTIKYSDRANIVHVYTDRLGLMSFAVPLGKTAKSRMRNALLMPLSLIEFEAVIAPRRELATMRDLRRAVPLSRIYAEPARSAIAIYISELLTHAIQEQEANPPLFRYLHQCVQMLENIDDGLANFHICFTYHLGAFLGIEPDTSTFSTGAWFDMSAGTFHPCAGAGIHWLKPDEARIIWLLSRMTFANMGRFRFNHTQRNQVLDTMLDYFRLHQSTLGSLRTPEVLKQLFI
ncbi:MAG: DNA repair protein RecO [Muribaculaceae bacterium]|nr:DNA repair protein RecO [Muribaculaceae bacterium]